MAEDRRKRAPRGWSSFTKQAQRLCGSDEDPDCYPPLAPGNGQASSFRDSVEPGSYFRALGNQNHVTKLKEEPVQRKIVVVSAGDVGQGKSTSDDEAIKMEKLLLDSPPHLNSENSQGGRLQSDDWEEDDAYLKLRKDAFKLSRLMSRHARSAANAYKRGDHHTAKQLSQRIQQERVLVEKLNAEAAAEIVSLRNDSNVWRIDLHGLHTSEAVAVLEKKLEELEEALASSSRYYKLEELGDPSVLSQGSTTDTSYHEGRGEPSSTSSGLLGTLRNPRTMMQRELTVITGTGAHSRNGPSLPNAVKTFLIANSYRFSEPRPGTFAVQLKQRRVQKL